MNEETDSKSLPAESVVREHPALYGQSVGMQKRNQQDIITELRKGLPVTAFDKLQKQLGVTSSSLAQVTNIALRTLQRRKKQGGRLQTDESERILRIGVLFDRAIEVTGSAESARTWMNAPIRPLGGSTPLAYCDTEPGAREVEDLLGRIEHGIFS